MKHEIQANVTSIMATAVIAQIRKEILVIVIKSQMIPVTMSACLFIVILTTMHVSGNIVIQTILAILL